jgi:uncharacterized Zn finger protein
MLESKDRVATFSCTCPAGQYRCSHVACVLLHLAKNVSATDVTCMWKQVATVLLMFIKFKINDIFN